MRRFLHVLLSLLVLVTLSSPASAFVHDAGAMDAASTSPQDRPCHGDDATASRAPQPPCCAGEHCPCDAMHSVALIPAFGIAAALPPPVQRAPHLVVSHPSTAHEPPLKPPTLAS